MLSIPTGRFAALIGLSAVLVAAVLVSPLAAQDDNIVPVCYVGLVVAPGESCSYPGTSSEFWVDESGRAACCSRAGGAG